MKRSARDLSASRKQATEPPTVLTVGHSTRPADEFITLLQAHGVTRLVDVRTVPRSRHNPQFNRDTLPATLQQAGISYTHMPGLGGLRRARADSPNTAWRNASFRGFADYMQTPEFTANLSDLIELARRERIAMMCAEAVPWRCHRSLIADALLVRGVRALEIQSTTRTRPHSLTPWAKVRGTRVTYPPEAGERLRSAPPQSLHGGSATASHRSEAVGTRRPAARRD